MSGLGTHCNVTFAPQALPHRPATTAKAVRHFTFTVLHKLTEQAIAAGLPKPSEVFTLQELTLAPNVKDRSKSVQTLDTNCLLVFSEIAQLALRQLPLGKRAECSAGAIQTKKKFPL